MSKREEHGEKREDHRTDEPLGEASGPSDARQDAHVVEAAAAAFGAPLLPSGPIGPVSPMLCAQEGAPLADPEWLYELKLDGVRIIAEKDGRRVTLRGRTTRDVTSSYPEVARALQALAARRVMLDGEIIALDARGQPSFQALARRIHRQSAARVRLAMIEIPVLYVAFDLLAVGDRDLRGLPLLARKLLLQRLLSEQGTLRALEFVEDDSRPLLSFCEAQRLEGVVAKRKLSAYQEGPERTSDWVKRKREREDDFVIVGWTQGEGARARLGALDVASYDGDRLLYRGKVGSGFDELGIDHLLTLLSSLASPQKTATGRYAPAPRGRTHVRPEVVASIRHAGFSQDGQIWHGVFRGLRDDIAPRECTAGPPAARSVARPVNAAAAAGAQPSSGPGAGGAKAPPGVASTRGLQADARAGPPGEAASSGSAPRSAPPSPIRRARAAL
jgi:bifunctional non-homologous end joining protein LigD